MMTEALTEILLYIALLLLLGLLRFLQKWNSPKQAIPASATHVLLRTKATIPKPTPQRMTSPYFAKRMSTGPSEEANWRSSKPRDSPVADLCQYPGKETKPPGKSVPKVRAPLQTIPIKQERRPVIDLTHAFEKERMPAAVAQHVPAPPNSPVLRMGNEERYGPDPSLLENMLYDRWDNYAADTEETLSQDNVKFEKDLDYERRRAYLKRQITDGEIMAEIDGWRLCLLFVHGIEYHYCVKDGVCQWELPPREDIANKCKDWYLVLPKSKRKKYGLEVPPAPLEPDEADHDPSFAPVVYHNELVLF